MAYAATLWERAHQIDEHERERKHAARQRKMRGELSTAEFDARYACIEHDCADLRSDMFAEFLLRK